MLSVKSVLAVCVFIMAEMFAYGADGLTLQNFMEVSSRERVAVVGIGDSNQRFGGNGWNKYMAAAIQQRFGSFGTGVHMCGNMVPDWIKPKPNGSKNSGAPEVLDLSAFSYWYLPSGASQRIEWSIVGLNVPNDHPMGIQGRLEYHLVYGTFSEPGGSFMPSVRMNKTPWTTLFSSQKVSTTDSASMLKTSTLSVPADSDRDYKLLFSPAPVNSTVTGPLLLAYADVVNVDKTCGCSYQTLYAAGGHSLYDMLSNLGERGVNRIATYFQAVRDTLNGQKSCLVMINSGLNDRNATKKSLGPNASDLSRSQAGYYDNLDGLVKLLESAWIKAGGGKKTIFFAFMPSHPISTPDDPKLVSYRKAASELAQTLSNAACIMLPELVSQETMLKDGYYDKHGKAHLSPIGYQKISEAVVKALAK